MTTVAASTTESSSGTKSQAALALKALLVVQILIGYEWFMSGLTKVVDGGFPSGLGDELRETSEGVGGWYESFLDGTVIPNAKLFGVLIEVGELAIGIALIGAAIVWLVRWSRLPDWGQTLVLIATAAAAVGGASWRSTFTLPAGRRTRG